MAIDRQGEAKKARAKRRLTVYPGEVSVVLGMGTARKVREALASCTIPEIRYLVARLDSALATAERLASQQSAIDRGNF